MFSVPHLSPCGSAATPIDVKRKAGGNRCKHAERSSHRAGEGSDIMVSLTDAGSTSEIEVEMGGDFVSDDCTERTKTLHTP
jgi:hypothetical protein